MEDLLVAHVTTDARNILHEHEHMPQHDVRTRLGCVRTPHMWYDLVFFILYALPKLLSGVNSVGVNRILHGTSHVKLYRIKVQ
jgi:hypothetical protein